MRKHFILFISLCMCWLLFQEAGVAASTARQVDAVAAGFQDGSTNVPLSGGKVNTYSPNTTTAKTCWTDAAKSTAAANPFILDSDGRGNLYCDGAYDFVITDSDDTSFATIEDYNTSVTEFTPDDDALTDLGSEANEFRDAYINRKIYVNKGDASNVILIDGSTREIHIGGTSAVNPLDVEGSVAIGATYAGTTAAPSNGAIIEGNVGIGTNAPQSTLDVEGSVAIGATYSGTTAAPSNGAIIEGNVGIGTNAPTNKLSVAGNTNVVGNITVTGTSSITGAATFGSQAELQAGFDSTSTTKSIIEITTTTDTNNSKTALVIRRTTTQAMATGFGSILEFQAKDNGGVNNTQAFIEVERTADGDNGADMNFWVRDTGTSTAIMTAAGTNGLTRLQVWEELGVSKAATFSSTATIEGDSIIVATAQSPAAAAACTTGEIAWDASYIYVCTASNAWKRAALTGGY